MAPLPKFVISPIGRLLHLVGGVALTMAGVMLFTSTTGAGLLGLGIFGVVGGIFSHRYAHCLQRLFGSAEHTIASHEASDADKSLYELNFVRDSLRRGRNE